MSQIEKPWRPFQVLVVSDSEWGARSLDSVLEARGYAVLHARTGRAAIDLAVAAQPHAVILDSDAPDMSGVDLCRLLTGDPRFLPTTPIILMTAHVHTRSERMEAFEAGAWEVCARPFDGAMMLRKLQTFVRAKQCSERWRANSLLDGETGLYNSEGLTRRAREIGAHAFRCQEAVACVAFTPSAMADDAPRADAIPSYTAAYIADACRRNARSCDVIGRLSDTQFALIAPATDSRGAMLMVDRLRGFLHAEPVLADRPALTIRAGYCTTPNYKESGMSVEDMVLRAASVLDTLPGDSGVVDAVS